VTSYSRLIVIIVFKNFTVLAAHRHIVSVLTSNITFLIFAVLVV